jgi:hypothetical protein
MSDYEIFYSTVDADRECGWYWRAKGWGSHGMAMIEKGPFATADEARADAEEEFERT